MDDDGKITYHLVFFQDLWLLCSDLVHYYNYNTVRVKLFANILMHKLKYILVLNDIGT